MDAVSGIGKGQEPPEPVRKWHKIGGTTAETRLKC